MVTENLFGDILTDEASVITGSLGMLPSALQLEFTLLYLNLFMVHIHRLLAKILLTLWQLFYRLL